MNKTLLLLLFLCCWHFSKAQNGTQLQKSPEIIYDGLPLMQNFMPKDYRGKTQNWAVEQDDSGMIYVGNDAGGVRRYDGKKWEYLPIGTTARMRAMEFAGRRLYVGAVSEFGYLEEDAFGNMNYTSLSSLLDSADRVFEDVWKVYAIGSTVYFMAFEALFSFDMSEQAAASPTYKVWKPEGAPFHGCYRVGEHIYVRQWEKGLMRLNPTNNQLELLPDGEKFALERIYVLEERDAGGLLIGTHTQAFFVYDPKSKSIQKLHSPDDAFLAEAQMYRSTKLPDGNLAVGTRREGLLIISQEGKILWQLDNKSGLPVNTVWDVFLDKENSLWCGLDNGLSKIEILSPFRFYGRESGLDGTVYSIITHQGKLYVSTALGLFEKTAEGQFVRHPKTKTETWDLLSFKTPEGNHLLLLAENNGIYQVDGNVAKPVFEGSYCFSLLQDQNRDGVLLAGMLTGYREFQYRNGKWISIAELKDAGNQIFSMIQDEKGDIWLGTSYEGVNRLIPQGSGQYQIKKYPLLNGKPLENSTVTKKGGNVLLCAPTGFYEFDEGNDEFKPLKQTFEGFDATPIYWTETNTGQLYIGGETCGSFRAFEQQGKQWKPKGPAVFKRLGESLAGALLWEQDRLWIGMPEGLVVYHEQSKNPKAFTSPALKLLRVTQKSGDSLALSGNFQLAYDENSIEFQLSALHYGSDPSQKEFSYHLEGNGESGWSPWAPESKIKFPNLGEGNYTFYAKARNVYGTESPILQFRFSVAPPWYRTTGAYLLYLLAAILLVYAAVKINSARLERENQRLERIIQDRTEEVQAQNVELSQQKEEIETQADNIKKANKLILSKNEELERQKEAVQKSFRDFNTLSEIGKEVTEELDLGALVEKVYWKVNELMQAEAFGIGLYKPYSNTIDFSHYMENGQMLPPNFDRVDDPDSLAAWAFLHEKTVFINDVDSERRTYIPNNQDTETFVKAGKKSNSVIYMPLASKGQTLGVITVQSFNKHAYSSTDLNVLQTLASYIVIAVENASTYGELKDKSQTITDSIRYGRRIQQGLLPSNNDLTKAFASHFVIYLPKDYVSGDFYWMSEKQTEKGKQLFFAAIDCVGHGVPGAFVTMMANFILHEAVNQFNLEDPVKILEYMDDCLCGVFALEGEQVDNSMDLSIARFDATADGTSWESVTLGISSSHVLHWDGEDLRFHRNRAYVGYGNRRPELFKSETLALEPGNILYFFSDGFADQNNSKSKKIGTGQILKRIKGITHLDLSQQKESMLQMLHQHQGDQEQRDDIMMLGFKI